MFHPTFSVLLILAFASASFLVRCGACDFDGAVHQPLFRQLEGEAPLVEECATNPLSFEEKYQLARAVVDWKDSRDNDHRALGAGSGINSTITIPVYFHILQYDEDVGNMNRSTITKGFMPTMNKAYADTPFEFVLKKVTHTIEPDYHNCSKGFVEYSFKSELRQGDRNALNIYVCNAYGSGVSGWGTYPLVAGIQGMNVVDGVVIQNPELFGTYLSSYYSAIHEIGHWFGLLHTFEDGCATANTTEYYDDDLSIYTNLVNDGVSDTPSHARPTDEYPGYETCWRNASLDTCDDSIPGIDVGMDPIDNFMNYNGPVCRDTYGRFTAGQIERMRAQYETFRTVSPTKLCRKNAKPCRRNPQCCIGLTCIRNSLDQPRGRCRKCRQPGLKCSRNTDCCYGACNKDDGKCRFPKQ